MEGRRVVGQLPLLYSIRMPTKKGVRILLPGNERIFACPTHFCPSIHHNTCDSMMNTKFGMSDSQPTSSQFAGYFAKQEASQRPALQSNQFGSRPTLFRGQSDGHSMLTLSQPSSQPSFLSQPQSQSSAESQQEPDFVYSWSPA
jgi:hypothetical protein